MQERYSRRSFLSGVITCGALSATAIYLLPGGRSRPSVDLHLITGTDDTGARNLLIRLWEEFNPDAKIRVTEVTTGSVDQRIKMLSEAGNRTADILNLDIIDISEFSHLGLITPVSLPDGEQFLRTVDRVNRADVASGAYWAAPFNTDVGMLFRRRSSEVDTEFRSLVQALDNDVAEGSQQFVGQLGRGASNSSESFVVNILEHAISREPGVLNGDGNVSFDLAQWQKALGPLVTAIRAGKVRLAAGEAESLSVFVDDRRRYMRNWPVTYRELQKRGDAGVRANLIHVDRLPTGILGGQSLAIVAGSPHAAQAQRFIEFATGEPAQKILASHGFAPTRIGAYDNDYLDKLIPHLQKVRQAVEQAKFRPLHPKYREFAEHVTNHVGLMLDGQELTSQFIDDITRSLSS